MDWVAVKGNYQRAKCFLRGGFEQQIQKATLHTFHSILKWSFTCLFEGTFPTVDHMLSLIQAVLMAKGLANLWQKVGEVLWFRYKEILNFLHQP